MASISISSFVKCLVRKPDYRDSIIRSEKRLAARKKVAKENKAKEDTTPFAAVYYSRACGIVRNFHKHNHHISWLTQRANYIESLIIDNMTKRQKQTLKNNARGILDYSNHFANQRMQIMPLRRLQYTYSDLVINIQPDVYAIRHGLPHMIKLNFSKDIINDLSSALYWDTYTQMIYLGMFQHEYFSGNFRAATFHVSHQSENIVSGLSDINLIMIEDVCSDILERWNTVYI